jgi:DNA-binding MarR family transcriptional regulator
MEIPIRSLSLRTTPTKGGDGGVVDLKLISSITIKHSSSQGATMSPTKYQSDLSIDEKVLMGVIRTAESFKRVFSAIFKKYDLSFPQYNILRVLDASTNGQSRITEVSRIMLVPGANMTGLAKRLERSGFILRKSDAKDERVTLLEITSTGKETLKKIEKERDQGLKNMLKGFSKEEKLALVDQVKRLIRTSRPMA